MIHEFQGPHRFLSNFWPAPVTLDGITYPSVENAYQAAKTRISTERKHFETCPPGMAKKLGRAVTLRPDWNTDTKLSVMRSLLTQKFSHPDLRDALLRTGETPLQEGNRWNDRFWGVCLITGRGENHLGKLLMSIRSSL